METSLAGSRPYSRGEAARMVAAAAANARIWEVPPAAADLLEQLKREFQEELDGSGEDGSTWLGGSFRLRKASLRYVLQDGTPAEFPGTDAEQFPLNYNNEGIDYANGHNGQATLLVEGGLFGHVLADWRPSIQVGEGGDADLTTRQGSILAALGPLALQVGRQPLWWGQGRHGSLLLTNNAEPFDLVRLTNPRPGRLPGWLQYLGPIRFDLFLGRLDADRIVPEPYLGGLRLNFRPFRWLELGAARTVMFGGEGRPGVGFRDFLTILGGNNLSGRDDTSNSLAAIDGRLILPMLWDLQLYGELGGEDEAGGLFSKNAFLAGLYLPRLDPSGRLGARIEYADTSSLTATPVWYRHSIYRSGYIYRDHLLGHHAGGDARDWFFELEALFAPTLSATLSLDYERRGSRSPVESRHLQPAVGFAWGAQGGMTWEVDYSLDLATDVDGIEGNDETFHLLSASVTMAF